MAGLGSRFRKAGYTLPKYEIEVRGKTIFEWSMLSLKGFAAKKYVFIVRKEDDSKSFIQKICNDMMISAEVLEIDSLTLGQAETAMLAESFWKESEPILIYNIDTYVEPGEMNYSQIHGDGFIPCFNGKGDHWSFVKLDEQGKALEIREKQRISNYCTVGAYYFRSAKLYTKLYKEYYLRSNKLEAGERYVAPLYNYLIERGGEVFISDIPADKVHVLGTPEEVEVFQSEATG